MSDSRPLLDRVQDWINVNVLIGILYLTLGVWGFVSFWMIPINVNTEWPIAMAVVCIFCVSLIHFGMIAIGVVFVPDYILYPVAPQWIYIVADVVMLSVLVGVITSYFQNTSSSTVPLFGLWLVMFSLGVHTWKIFLLVKQTPQSIVTEFSRIF